MIRVIKDLLLKIIDSIDSGNSDITEDLAIEIIKAINLWFKDSDYKGSNKVLHYFKEA